MNFRELGAQIGLEEDEYRELIELFIESGGADFSNLRQALAAGNADQVMRSAHTIKGASGNLGLMKISEAARIIEESANNNCLDNLEPTVKKLKSLFEIVRAFAANKP